MIIHDTEDCYESQDSAARTLETLEEARTDMVTYTREGLGYARQGSAGTRSKWSQLVRGSERLSRYTGTYMVQMEGSAGARSRWKAQLVHGPHKKVT